MPNCSVCGRSRNMKSKAENITFHKFPINNIVREKWNKFLLSNNLSAQDITRNSVICSKHFVQTLFVTHNSKRFLLKHAVPSKTVIRVKHDKTSYPEEVIHLNQPIVFTNSESKSSLDMMQTQVKDLKIPVSSVETPQRSSGLKITTPKYEISQFEDSDAPDNENDPGWLFLKRALRQLSDEVKLKNRTLKLLHQKLRRQIQKLESMNAVTLNLRKENGINNDAAKIVPSTNHSDNKFKNSICKNIHDIKIEVKDEVCNPMETNDTYMIVPVKIEVKDEVCDPMKTDDICMTVPVKIEVKDEVCNPMKTDDICMTVPVKIEVKDEVCNPMKTDDTCMTVPVKLKNRTLKLLHQKSRRQIQKMASMNDITLNLRKENGINNDAATNHSDNKFKNSICKNIHDIKIEVEDEVCYPTKTDDTCMTVPVKIEVKDEGCNPIETDDTCMTVPVKIEVEDEGCNPIETDDTCMTVPVKIEVKDEGCNPIETDDTCMTVPVKIEIKDEVCYPMETDDTCMTVPVKIEIEDEEFNPSKTDEIFLTVPITLQPTSLSTESIADKLQQLCNIFELHAGTLNDKQLKTINASIDTAVRILYEGEHNLIHFENQEPVNENTKNQTVHLAPEELRLNNKCTLQNSEFDHSYAKLFFNYTAYAEVSNLHPAFQADDQSM